MATVASESLPKHRVYVDHPLRGDRWALDPKRAHYLRRVLRLAEGDPVVAFDGSGSEWIAILRTGPEVFLQQRDRLPARNTEGLVVTLVQALARGDRMDIALQKATELGVTAVQPVTSARTEVRLRGARAERRMAHWRGVLVHATEQCGRVRVPDLLPLSGLAEWLAEPPPAEMRLILSPSATTGLSAMAWAGGPIQVLVGPEGGFTTDEIELAARRGFSPLRLGPRILRTETAGTAALAAMQTLWGDLAADAAGQPDQPDHSGNW